MSILEMNNRRSLQEQHDHLLEEFEIEQEDEELPANTYWIFLVYGVAMLLPWNVFITASDHFAFRFLTSGYETTFQNYFSAIFNCTSLVSLAVLFFYKTPLQVEIPLWINLVTFLFFAVSSVVTPIPPTVYFWITLGFIGVTGVTTSMLQSSIVAEASQFIPKYMQAVMSGQGIAGVSVALFSFITLSVPTFSYSAFCYFSYAILVTVAAIFARRKQTKMCFNSMAQTTPCYVVVREIPIYLCTLVYIYVITLALFPSKTVQIKSVSGINPAMFTSLHFLLFNVGDWIGRTLPLYFQIVSSRLLVSLAIARTCFIPLFAHDFGNDGVFVALLTLFSVSNGWLTSMVFMAAPHYTSSQPGTVLGFFLAVGLAIGGLMSFFI